jgi:predicted outer membrane protein
MRKIYGWSLAALLGMTGVAWGQVRTADEPAAPRRPAAERAERADRDEDAAPAGRTPRREARAPGREIEVDVAAGKAGTADQQLAACIHGSCQNEIAIATFAQDRLQTDAAKQFAAKMIEEHTASCEKIGQIAGPLAAHDDHARPARPGTPRREEGEGEDPAAPRAGVKVEAGEVEVQAGGARRPGADITVRGAGAGGQLDWMAIHKEIGARCLESTKKEIGKHQGMDFDQAFMGQQLVAHLEMVDKLTVLKNHASPELRQEIENGLEMANRHLQEARQVMGQLKDTETPPRTARRPGAPATEERPVPKAAPERRPE